MASHSRPPEPDKLCIPGDPNARYVVFDCETTGLDPEKDGIISIGAVVVQDDEIRIADSFEIIVKTHINTASVVVHGITSDESQSGVEEPEAVAGFLDFVGPGVLVGHHVGFDRKLIEVAARKNFGTTVHNHAIDTMNLALALEKADALGTPPIETYDLDALLQRFDIIPHDRHTAAGDAFLTAQLFLRLSQLAKRVDIDWQNLGA